LESVHLALLRPSVGGRALGQVLLQRAVHAFVAAVLLRMAGLDPLRNDAPA
jgi:hypothetical protein